MPSTTSENCHITSGCSGLPKFRQLTSAFGVAPNDLLPEIQRRMRNKPEIVEISRTEAPAGVHMVEVGSSRVNNGALAYALRIFGRPPRSTACDCERQAEPALPQTLYRMSDPAVQGKLAAKDGRLAQLLKTKMTDEQALEELFLATLSRKPNEADRSSFAKYKQDEPNRAKLFQDTLWALAGDTGGKALLDNNDLAAGIVQAQKAVSSYYIIGYYTSNQNLDGKFRRIKITLNNGLSASVDFRQGYFAGKTFNKFTVADKERQLEDALMLGDPITELTIAMEIDYFQLNRAEYFVPVVVKIPGRELALARKGGAERTVIDFIGEVKDEFGTTIQNVRDRVDIKLSGKQRRN